MTEPTRTEKARKINAHIDPREFLERSKGHNQFVCLACGSGNGAHENSDGALSYYERDNSCVCYAGCGKRKYSTLDLYILNQHKGPLDDVRTLLDPQNEYFKTAVNDLWPRVAAIKDAPRAEKKEETPLLDFRGYFDACAARLNDPRAKAYLDSRGISQETARKYGVGFDPEADPANFPGGMAGTVKHPTPRVIFPCGPNSYQGRSTDSRTEAQYRKMNPSQTLGAGPLGLFGLEEAMASSADHVFVVEGPFDALAVAEAGGVPVALNSATNQRKLIEALLGDARSTGRVFVVCMDNDGPGQKAQAGLLDALRAAGLPSVGADVCGSSAKDPSEALTANLWSFTAAIATAKGLEPDELPTEEEPTERIPRPADLSDFGNAGAFLKYFEGRLCFSEALGWMKWDGMRWSVDSGVALRSAGEWTETLVAYAERDAIEAGLRYERAKAEGRDDKNMKADAAEAVAYWSFTKKTRSLSKVKALLTIAAAEAAVDVDALDAAAHILNTPGGCYDLRTGECFANDPRLMCTKITAVAPGPDGAELWKDFVTTVCDGDQEKVRYLQYLCGAAAMGEVTDAVIGIFFCYSVFGSTGKSTFWGALADVLGDYAISFPVQLFTTASLYSDPKFKLPRLRGARLVLLNELPEKAVLSDGNLKAFASVDTITGGECKGKPPFDFRPSHTLVSFTNHLPRVNEIDSGTWRRIHVVPFNHVFSGDAVDPDFPRKLLDQAGPAILSWVIEGARLFVAAGKKLPPCAAVDVASAEYKQAEDAIGRFLEDRFERNPKSTTLCQDVYTDYRMWCGLNGEDEMRQKDLTAKLMSRGFEMRHTKRGNALIGLQRKGMW